MINIDVITGFLGAGKTTFMKNLLQKNVFGDEKIIIIENEFGDVPIDHKVLENNQYDLIEISGGCICCSLKGDIIDALHSIAENEKPDRILIEPSGIFIVEDLFEILEDKRITKNYVLNGIYTIVDASHFLIDKMRHAPFFSSQLRFASHILISKVDQQDELVIDTVIDGLSEFNHTAEIYAINYSKMVKEDLYGMFTGRDDTYLEDMTDKQSDNTDSHAQMISVGIRNVKVFEEAAWQSILKQVSSGTYGHVIRIKGYIQIGKQQFLMNYVSGVVEYELINDLGDSKELELTIIGTQLKVPEIRAKLSRLKMNYRKVKL